MCELTPQACLIFYQCLLAEGDLTMSRSKSIFSTSKSSINSYSGNTTISSQRVTVVEEGSSSDDEYLSTTEDNMTVERSTPRSDSTRSSYSRRSYLITERDTSRCETDFSDVREYQKLAAKVEKVSLLNKSPEFSPLLLRVAPLQRGRLVKLTGIRVSTPVQVCLLVQAKKHTVLMQLVPSLESPRFCYETVPSFLSGRASLQFIIKGKEETIKALVMPPKQQIKKGVLPRRTTTPLLLLPPEGPSQAEVLQPLWDSVTFTVSFGKHVAVEYSIPQVPVRKVRFYKAEKYPIKAVNSAVLYRKTKKELVVVERAAQMYQLKLSTVEKEDPQLVRVVRVEQNNRYSGEVHNRGKPALLTE